MYAKWRRMLRCINNQDVGSEAAIIKRVRNSSLVECLSAENVAGLSILPKQRIHMQIWMVGERSLLEEGIPRGVLDGKEVRMPV